jgi:hypothetical protein
MLKSCSTEAKYSSAKGNITIEETNFQPAKMPNRGYMDATYPWNEGPTTLGE